MLHLLHMKKIILFTLFFSINAQAQKEILCSDGVCAPNFNPRDQFEKIYHSGIDVGFDNEDDILVKTSANQAPRAARIYVDNKPGHVKNATINLTSGSEFYNAADGMLIGNMFNNVKMILNGYSGITGKSASQVCAEKYQMGGSAGYGDIARAEFQAKRIDNPTLPINRCVYADVEYLQNNSFTCDEDEFTPIDSLNPSVTVRRFRGKNKCLGVSFNDVCLQRTVEVTCKWTLRYTAPANVAGTNSTVPSENFSKKFIMSESEFNSKYVANPTKWGNYFCNNLAKSEEEAPEAELVTNSGFNRNADNWTLSGNSYWVNSKLKLYSGPVLNDPSDGVGGVKKIPTVGNPVQQSFKGYPITVYLNFIPKSPVVNPNQPNITFMYKRSGFNCPPNANECTFTHPADGTYYSDLLLATVKIEDSNGYKSYYDIKADIGFAYDQTTAYVGGYGKKMRCSGGTASNSTLFKYTINENNVHCANGRCFSNSQAIRAVQVWHPTASSILVWHRLSGDWRRKCGGDYIYSVGYHFFLRHYPRVKVVKKINVENWPAATARQVIQTQSGRTYRLTAFLKSALEELRAVNGTVNVYDGASAISSNLLTSIKVGESGLKYPLTKTRLTPVDFTFKAESSSTLIELVQDQLEYSAYFDDISVKRVSFNAGPPVKPTDPPIANVTGVNGVGYYMLSSALSPVRTTPGYDVEQTKVLPDSSWRISYTPIGAECPAYFDKIKTNYLASAIAYDENDNACDDVSVPEDSQGVLSWKHVGFDRKSEFGMESLSCAPGNCQVDFTLEDKSRRLDLIDTSNGISGTQQGQGVIFVYDAQSIQTQSNVGIPGYAGPNDLPVLSDTRMCARIKDALNSSETSPFASSPSVQFRRYKWNALEVTGSNVQPKIPENNGKRVYIYKKLDSSLRHLLKQELL